jgi:hypothetical protein
MEKDIRQKTKIVSFRPVLQNHKSILMQTGIYLPPIDNKYGPSKKVTTW